MFGRTPRKRPLCLVVLRPCTPTPRSATWPCSLTTRNESSRRPRWKNKKCNQPLSPRPMNNAKKPNGEGYPRYVGSDKPRQQPKANTQPRCLVLTLLITPKGPHCRSIKSQTFVSVGRPRLDTRFVARTSHCHHYRRRPVRRHGH